MGDESEVSALSAVSEEDMQQQELAENQKTVTHRNQLPKGGHKRNVSWGVYDAPSSKGSADSPSTGSVNLQQPDLTGTGGGRGGTMNGISGGGAAAPTGPLPPSLKPKRQVQRNKTVDSIISNLSPNPGHQRTNTRITLTDLTSNPLEDEAENAIIRALEAREWEHNNHPAHENLELERALHGNDAILASPVDSGEKTGILSGIPDAALQMVKEEEQESAAAAGVMAGIAAAASSNSLVDLQQESKERPSLTVSTSTAPRPPPSPTRSVTKSPKRSPVASSAGMKFEDIAAQLKNAQIGAGRARANTSTSGGTGGYLLKAAAAYKAAQSTRNLVDGSGGSRQMLHTVGSKDSSSQHLKESTPSTRLQKLESSDSDSDDDPISAGDMMVKNMNKMLGLPNKLKDEEEARKYEEEREQRRRKESDSYDVEAQQQQAP